MMRQLLVLVAVTLFTIAALHAVDGEWPEAVILFGCSIVVGVARERF
jgi:hypothetical protein